MLTRSRVRQIADAAVIALLLGATGLPLTGAFLAGRFSTANDMRELAGSPELSLKRSVLCDFPAKFEMYWNDHFGFRGSLIRCLHLTKVFWLNVPTSAHVLLGRAPWLFYTTAPAGQDYEYVRPFTEAELEHWQRMLERRQAWLARQHCRYLVFIPPDKQTIYPEHLDPAHRRLHPETRLDQFVRHMRQHSTVPVLDIREAMRAAKARERLYDVTDSHWNDRGAFIGYQHLGAALSQWFPRIVPLPRSAFRATEMETRGGDLATLVDLAERRHEEHLNLVPLSPRRARRSAEGVVPPKDALFPLGEPWAMERDDPSLPRAVVFHDSFMLALGPFLSEHFRRAAYVWHDDFHPEVIERERPDVVIQEMLERKLGWVVPAVNGYSLHTVDMLERKLGRVVPRAEEVPDE